MECAPFFYFKKGIGMGEYRFHTINEMVDIFLDESIPFELLGRRYYSPSLSGAEKELVLARSDCPTDIALQLFSESPNFASYYLHERNYKMEWGKIPDDIFEWFEREEARDCDGTLAVIGWQLSESMIRKLINYHYEKIQNKDKKRDFHFRVLFFILLYQVVIPNDCLPILAKFVEAVDEYGTVSGMRFQGFVKPTMYYLMFSMSPMVYENEDKFDEVLDASLKASPHQNVIGNYREWLSDVHRNICLKMTCNPALTDYECMQLLVKAPQNEIDFFNKLLDYNATRRAKFRETMKKK